MGIERGQSIVPDSESEPEGEQSEGLYTDEDIEQWQEGARKWHKFVEDDRVRAVVDYHATIYGPGRGPKYGSERELQAMFLGEKPAITWNHLASNCADELQKLGYVQEGDYIYDPHQVEDVIKDNPDVFADRGLSAPNRVASVDGYMEANNLDMHKVYEQLIASEFLSDEEESILIDGFNGNREDKEGVKRLFIEKMTKHASELNIEREDIPRLMEELDFISNSKQSTRHGLDWTMWVDYEDYPESKARVDRLKAAFEKSGILEETDK
jgi:hypothetical protein